MAGRLHEGYLAAPNYHFHFPLLLLLLFLRYLKEQIKQLKEEKNMAVSALARYKVRMV